MSTCRKKTGTCHCQHVVDGPLTIPCRYGGIKQPTRAVEHLDNDEKGVSIIHTLGGEQEMLTVTEPGLYRLVMRSRKKVR